MRQLTAILAMADSELARWSPMEQHTGSLKPDLPVMQQLQQLEDDEVLWPYSEDALLVQRAPSKATHMNEQIHVGIR
ncbi:hypothetical protein ATERTT37_000336 [Aspergillus terreus]